MKLNYKKNISNPPLYIAITWDINYELSDLRRNLTLR